jgi:hypothetical protein
MSSEIELTLNDPPIEDNTYGWNDRLETIVKNIGETSKSYKLMHINVSLQAERQYTNLMYASVILGPLSGVVAGIGITVNGGVVFPVCVSIIGFLSGVVGIILKFGKYEQVKSSNKLAASRYTSLESNIRRQLSLYRNNRVDPQSYIAWVSKSFDELFLASPLIPNDIYDRYTELAKEQGIVLPQHYSDVIYINSEYETEKARALSNCNEIIVNKKSPADEEDETVNIKMIGSQSTKFQKTCSAAMFHDLNIFDEAMMLHEMKRFAGFQG